MSDKPTFTHEDDVFDEVQRTGDVLHDLPVHAHRPLVAVPRKNVVADDASAAEMLMETAIGRIPAEVMIHQNAFRTFIRIKRPPSVAIGPHVMYHIVMHTGAVACAERIHAAHIAHDAFAEIVYLVERNLVALRNGTVKAPRPADRHARVVEVVDLAIEHLGIRSVRKDHPGPFEIEPSSATDIAILDPVERRRARRKILDDTAVKLFAFGYMPLFRAHPHSTGAKVEENAVHDLVGRAAIAEVHAVVAGMGKRAPVELEPLYAFRRDSTVKSSCRLALIHLRGAIAEFRQRGIGIGGKIVGMLAVERGENRETFDFNAFAGKYVPHPELVVRFKSTTVDYGTLKSASSSLPEKGKFTPYIRRPFVYVVAVPDAGEYKIRFNSRKVRKGGKETLGAVVQMLDRAGTDLGKFDVPVGDFEYTLKARGANVYRFEVSQRNSAIIRMACDSAAGALLADSPVSLFTGQNESFYFCVPAEADTVLVRINPAEAVQAKLLNASGDVVAEMPYETKQAIFKVKREKMTSDEVWQLKFVKIQEDMSFQIGVGAIPLGSVDTESVIGRRLNFQ